MNIICGNKFKALADLVIDEETGFPEKIEGNPKIIFLYTDWTWRFCIELLPLIDWPFVLITHNSDHPAPGMAFPILNSPFLIHWFGMNVDARHPKLSAIPIGIANPKWPHGDEETLKRVMAMDIPKTGKCYVNFNPYTHSSRTRLYPLFKGYKWLTVDETPLPYEEYLEKLKSFEFVISPRGNSVDCHRIWESLYVGTTPIVLEAQALEQFYSLPILFKRDWGMSGDLVKPPGRLEILDMDYWISRIERAASV